MGFAALLEGSFTSHFAQTLPSILRDDADFAFRSSSAPTAMVVISDGDVARNKFRSDGKILPLGYDRYARRVVYDNKEFLLNTINYLLPHISNQSIREKLKTSRCEAIQSAFEVHYYSPMLHCPQKSN